MIYFQVPGVASQRIGVRGGSTPKADIPGQSGLTTSARAMCQLRALLIRRYRLKACINIDLKDDSRIMTIYLSLLIEPGIIFCRNRN